MKPRTCVPIALFAVTACVDVPTYPLMSEQHQPAAVAVTIGNPPIIQYAPYPIHLRWWTCPEFDSCSAVNTTEGIPDRIIRMAEAAAAKWAAVLAPTIPRPFIVPDRLYLPVRNGAIRGGRHDPGRPRAPYSL